MKPIQRSAISQGFASNSKEARLKASWTEGGAANSAKGQLQVELLYSRTFLVSPICKYNCAIYVRRKYHADNRNAGQKL